MIRVLPGWPLRVWLGPIGFRFGIHQHPLPSERWQGTRGIPVRFYYLFGKRLTIMRRKSAT